MIHRLRRDIAPMSLSFLDVISCGFGAIVLLLVLTKTAEPIIIEQTTEGLNQHITALRAQLAEIHDASAALNQHVASMSQKLPQAQARLNGLRSKMAELRAQFSQAAKSSEVTDIIADRLAIAKQDLTEEMKRLLGAGYRRKGDVVGGIPVDSEYIIFVIDTSGSMVSFSWPLVLQKVAETLSIYPRVKGIQVLNDMGTYMFSQYRGKWIPDTPARRSLIIQRLRRWNPFSNSSPVEGITEAVRTFYAPDKKISIYVFGDEFTGGSIEAVISAVDAINKVDARGNRLVRIHALGFPGLLDQGHELTTIRYAALMRSLTYKNGGSFVGVTGDTLKPRLRVRSSLGGL